MESAMDHHAALAALAWQVELGADEAIGDTPVDRFALDREAPKPVAAPAAPTAAPAVNDAPDPVRAAQAAADAATDLDSLRRALGAYEHCDLRHGARNLVFADGNPAAPLMIIGESPGGEEDRAGRPFVGRAGQLLDRMLGAIGLDRASQDPATAVYITNVLPWRPPQNRDPRPDEIAMMTPFVHRHIDLVAPQVIVLMGNTSCQTLLGKRGITRLRGQWDRIGARPCLPMLHPAYLLRQPAQKRKAWDDLLALRARLKELT